MVERVNLHEDDESELHCMIISKDKGENTSIMCHPHKDMVFVILKGQMKIDTYGKNGKISETILYEPINKCQTYIKLIKKGVYYQMRALTDVTYVEVNKGPFNKKTHNRYL